MIYNSLSKIPYKIFLEIIESGDITLLSDENIEIEKLQIIWKELYSEHLDKIQDVNRLFSVSKEIEYLKNKHIIVLTACDYLRFTVDPDFIYLLTAYGYTLRTTEIESYYSDINQIEKESNAYQMRINRLSEKLPKQTGVSDSYIDDVMACYSAVLGFDFDYNTISYTKFYSLQKQVQYKVNSLKNNLNG